ncbi:MAG: hypothetical protein RLZZ401_1894 [Pseudomonadota bacterium]
MAVVAGMAAAYAWSERMGFEQLDEVANRQLDLYASTLESELAKHAYLPSLIAVDQDIVALFDAPGQAAVRASAGRKLASFKVRAGALTAFAYSPDGVLLASSGYRPDAAEAQPLVRPSLLQPALRGERFQFFAANSEGASEYYFTQRMRRDLGLLGIVGVKISLDPLESTWIDMGVRSESEKILVMDDAGVVIMSSVPAWKYAMVNAIAGTAQSAPHQPEKYPSPALVPLRMQLEKSMTRGAMLVRIPGLASGPDTLHVVQDRTLPQWGWRIMILSDPQDVWRYARYAAWGGGGVAAFFGLLALYLLQRRRAMQQLSVARNALQNANTQLELKVDQRTGELRRANQELVNEMHERQLAQDELVQAGKLAALGQMSAGISHEINQPLTALLALSSNTTLLLASGRTEEAMDNLKAIGEVAGRMGSITAQLKSFARKSPGMRQPISLATAVGHMWRLLEHRTRAQQVQLELDVPAQPLVLCDMNRLEQVLINLATNALDAMRDTPMRALSIRAWPVNGRMTVCVADTGPGMPDELLARLFEPFFTTKPSGEGLGLGLVISSNIIREFGSTLRASKGHPGLVFEFDLELAQGENNV